MRPGTIRTAAILALCILALPSVTYGQQGGKIWRIGMISTLPPATWRALPGTPALLSGLHDLGYDEGRNFTIEYRWTEGDLNRLPAIAAEVVALNVDVIFRDVCGAVTDAVMQATKTIPIVVAACNYDMIEAGGMVASLAHPGGNLTGLNKMTPELAAKRLDLLKEICPKATDVAVLWDPTYSQFAADWRALRATAQARGVVLHSVEASNSADLDAAFGSFLQDRPDAILSLSDTLTYVLAKHVASLATDDKLPIVTPYREITEAGGLMSYGPNIPAMFRRSATYIDKILRGAKPADLPVEQPSTFELVVNVKAAKLLGIEISPQLLARADEVIE
jgi:putative tryptophan/tyrosine transport system substrate-binding protein